MPKNLKPLVISTSRAPAVGSEFVWNKLQNPGVFIASIVTPDVNIETSEELNRLVSGIPTPFARPAMFKYAINYLGEAGEEPTGLLKFYKTLKEEWKGLVACIALDNQPISVEKVMLQYSDGRAAEDSANIYEPKGALGNMLFEDRELWCDQLEHMDSTQRAIPFIYIIRYNGLVIGGTSPESLLFTPPVYDINTKKGFYNKDTKKFTDPLRANLSREEVEKLYVYVRHINASMQSYKDQFTKRKPEVSRIERFLADWLVEIKSYATKKGYEIDPNAIVPNLNKFKAPFDKLFNFQTTLYGYGGRITVDKTALHLPDGVVPVEVELAELLLNADTCTVAEVTLDDPGDARLMGVHLLRAPSDKGDKYFTIPLSEKGLAIFQDEIEGLLESGGDVRSHLSGVYDMATKTLQITLQVDVNGNTTSFTKSYKDPIRVEGQKVICWPDFVSPIWNKYYLYSELPHNGPELKAFPLRADRNGFGLITDEEGDRYQFKKIAVNGRKVRVDDPAEILVEYDMNKVGSTDLKYEIYESPDPFKGIELQFKNKLAGYVVFRGIKSNNPYTLKDYRTLRVVLNPVRVGFDFGSNNICVSFAEAGQQPKLIAFKNRRRCILGADTPDSGKVAAGPNEVFFFQNEPTQSNQVKSMIMTHDERRVKGIEIDPTDTLKKIIKGGFPVFEKNIPVEKSEEATYTVYFTNQPSYIKFNMKWSNNKKENAYKEGLLKTLWLMSYAELLEEEKFPAFLVWAYPSSMSKPTLQNYGILWDDVGKVNPLEALVNSGLEYPNAKVSQFSGGRTGGSARPVPVRSRAESPLGANANRLDLRAQTEAASVCKHALGVGGFQAGERGLIIGFDVGGSTTDILCIALRKDQFSGVADDFKDTLIKEGSIRFAAGRLADATKRSPKFQEVLRSFCRKKGLYIHGITVLPDRLNSNTSSYYYNLIVDRLNTESELSEFYKNLGANCPELFTLNAFMTGLIMFYSGQLAYKIRVTQDENPGDYLAPFEDVMIGCFGKGGRMFDWLPAMNEDAALTYFQDCFYAGYGIKASEHIRGFEIRPTDIEHVKAEVSFGLAGSHSIHTTAEQISELIGEEGYTYNSANVDELAPVEARFLQNFGNQFATPREFKRFGEFAEIFRGFSKEYFGLNLPTMEQDIRNMHLKSYVVNIPDYQVAKGALEFDFEAPIIILEGMCFLDTVLMSLLFGK
jgi:hypothetical protein